MDKRGPKVRPADLGCALGLISSRDCHRPAETARPEHHPELGTASAISLCRCAGLGARRERLPFLACNTRHLPLWDAFLPSLGRRNHGRVCPGGRVVGNLAQIGIDAECSLHRGCAAWEHWNVCSTCSWPCHCVGRGQGQGSAIVPPLPRSSDPRRTLRHQRRETR